MIGKKVGRFGRRAWPPVGVVVVAGWGNEGVLVSVMGDDDGGLGSPGFFASSPSKYWGGQKYHT